MRKKRTGYSPPHAKLSSDGYVRRFLAINFDMFLALKRAKNNCIIQVGIYLHRAAIFMSVGGAVGPIRFIFFYN